MVNVLLVVAAALAFAVGAAHSLLGERYVLTRLFRRGNLPHLFGGEAFTRRTLRFAWHLTTIAWWGGAVLLLALAGVGPGTPGHLARIVAATFAASAVLTLAASRGRHLAWVVFAAIAALAWWGAPG